MSFNPLTFKLVLKMQLRFAAFLLIGMVRTIVLLVMMVVG